MNYWNWNFDLENKSVYYNAWLWTNYSNQQNNDIYGKNVVISNIVCQLDPLFRSGVTAFCDGTMNAAQSQIDFW